MKQIAIALLFSIILVTNTHTTLVAPAEKINTKNMHKLVVYEQTIAGHDLEEIKATSLNTNNPSESGNLCIVDEGAPSQVKINDGKDKGANEFTNDKREQLLDGAEMLSEINPLQPAPGDNMVNGRNKQHMIPDEAIRLRILAHSDTPTDQHIKKVVRDRVNEHIQTKVAFIDKIETARTVIEDTIPTLEAIIADTLVEYNEQYSYKVAFETDVAFPLKTYGPYVYPAGDYEAILITLGDGIGENWWCVLFPPLCFIDFFNSTTVVDAEDTPHDESIDELSDTESEITEEDVEVRFFLFDLFNFS